MTPQSGEHDSTPMLDPIPLTKREKRHIAFWPALGLVLVGLKLAGVLELPWGAVTAPFWGPFAFWVALFALALIVRRAREPARKGRAAWSRVGVIMFGLVLTAAVLLLAAILATAAAPLDDSHDDTTPEEIARLEARMDFDPLAPATVTNRLLALDDGRIVASIDAEDLPLLIRRLAADGDICRALGHPWQTRIWLPHLTAEAVAGVRECPICGLIQRQVLSEWQ